MCFAMLRKEKPLFLKPNGFKTWVLGLWAIQRQLWSNEDHLTY